MEFLRDPLWQFVGAFLGLIAIFITVYLFWLQQKRKRITYDVVFNTQLLQVNENVRENLEVFFKGMKIEGLHFVVIRLSNSGNVPVLQSDFDTPVTFFLGTTSNIIETQIIGTNPPNLHVEIEVTSSEIAIKPLLLNPEDFFEIKVLVTKYTTITAQGRVIGIKEIQKGDKAADGNAIENAFIIPLVISIFALIVVIVNLFIPEGEGKIPLLVILFFSGYIVNSIVGLITFFVGKSTLTEWQKKL